MLRSIFRNLCVVVSVEFIFVDLSPWASMSFKAACRWISRGNWQSFMHFSTIEYSYCTTKVHIGALQREALPPGGTPVTAETFAAWKAKKEAERLAALEQQQKDAKKALKAGPSGGAPLLSGKDLFSFNPALFVDSEGAADENDYAEDEDWAEEVRTPLAFPAFS